MGEEQGVVEILTWEKCVGRKEKCTVPFEHCKLFGNAEL